MYGERVCDGGQLRAFLLARPKSSAGAGEFGAFFLPDFYARQNEKNPLDAVFASRK